MTEFPIASLIVDLMRAYAAVGAVVALLFLLVGIDRYAPPARGAYAFRPLLFPGLVLLWPYVLRRWSVLEAARRRGG